MWSKPRVERAVQYVRGNFFAGEDFSGLAHAQQAAAAWCRDTAGMRIHGTIQARPAEVFAASEAGLLLPRPAPYDMPLFGQAKVHRDFHVEVARALYSAPSQYLGRRLDVRADSALVKLFHRGQLVRMHPRQEPGRRSTDPADLPAEKTTYAMRDIDSLVKAAQRAGENTGIYAQRLLDTDLPWTRMRQVYRLLGLVRRYGPGPVDTACGRALELDVVSVTKIASMLEKATENTPAQLAGPVAARARFARDPSSKASPTGAARNHQSPATSRKDTRNDHSSHKVVPSSWQHPGPITVASDSSGPVRVVSCCLGMRGLVSVTSGDDVGGDRHGLYALGVVSLGSPDGAGWMLAAGRARSYWRLGGSYFAHRRTG